MPSIVRYWAFFVLVKFCRFASYSFDIMKIGYTCSRGTESRSLVVLERRPAEGTPAALSMPSPFAASRIIA